jgi:DNA-binding MarR family transcriptional regulator
VTTRTETQAETGQAEGVDDLGWGLGALLRGYRQRVTDAIGDFPHGARGYQTMCAVVGGDHPSQLALARDLGIDKTVMTYLVDDLVEAGLVERRPNPADRRQRQVVATDRGARAVAELCRRVDAAEDDLLGRLDGDERATLRRLLSKATGPAPGHTAEACALVTGESQEAEEAGRPTE